MSDKEQKSIQRIKMASEMSLHHYGKPLVCTYSGGKDSDVMQSSCRCSKLFIIPSINQKYRRNRL